MDRDDAKEVYVYVGQQAKDNLQRGLERSVWGWKAEVVEGKPTAQVIELLGEGDLLHLGHLGIGRVDIAEAQYREVSRLFTARITGPWYMSEEPVWDDEAAGVSYPYRIPFEVEEVREGVSVEHIGPEGIEALRMSGIQQGTPQVPGGRESVMEQVLQKLNAERWAEIVDDGQAQASDHADLRLPTDLDAFNWTLVRREQSKLREAKLKGRSDVRCDLCQRVLPEKLVHTAHIKRRKNSDNQERRDLNNLMLACVLGCDSLFEHGYVYVDVEGHIHASNKAAGLDLTTAAQRISGCCSAFSGKSAEYFAWHQYNIAGMEES
ncbi:hypothetical protein [Nocardiopsis xinjiangensis]|uniref:hypothetical protein n=1 Tax=Nocardiopsis xinjiangensis TaxID=124285 RepID=UPI00034BC326|nr:hypothetical protein [Nocardiopsis xinjiangensis]